MNKHAIVKYYISIRWTRAIVGWVDFEATVYSTVIVIRYRC